MLKYSTTSYRDLKAVSTLLGTKPYMMGDKPSLLDCTVFGFVCQVILKNSIDMYLPLLSFPRCCMECPLLVSTGSSWRMSAAIWWSILTRLRGHSGRIGTGFKM